MSSDTSSPTVFDTLLRPTPSLQGSPSESYHEPAWLGSRRAAVPKTRGIVGGGGERGNKKQRLSNLDCVVDDSH